MNKRTSKNDHNQQELTMNKITSKKIHQLLSILVVITILCLPVSLALTINPDSVSVELDKNKATIAWETDVDASGIIRYGKNIENVFTIPETGAYKKDHEVKIDDLDYGEKYFYTVESGNGLVSVSLDGWKDFTTILPAVTGFNVEWVEADKVRLAWNQNDKAKKYNIYYAEVNTPFELVETQTSVYYEINDLMPDTTYKAKISAVDEFDQEGLNGQEIQFTTKQAVPEISFLQAVFVTDTSATISWKTNIPAKSKIIYDLDNTLDLIKEEDVLKTEHSIKLENLQTSTTYHYQVMAGKEKLDDGTFKPLIVSESKSFTTLSENAKLNFIDIAVSKIGEQTATITWMTSLEVMCITYYGIDDTFSSSKTESEKKIEHSILLDDLLPDIDYYFKLRCGDHESPVQTFTTSPGQAGSFLIVEPLPDYSTKTQVNITGKTKKGSKLYLFLNNDPSAKIKKVVNTTSYTESITLNPAANMDKIPGKNTIYVISWDENMKKDSKAVSTIVDIVIPNLQVNELPDVTGENQLNISGIAEINSKITIYIDNASKATPLVQQDGSFYSLINLGNKNQTIVVEARDLAGNINLYEKIVAVDKLSPKIDILTSLKGETHFKILTLEGKTEPNSKVYVTNYGEFNGCQDVEWTRNYGACESYIGRDHLIPGTLVSANIDPLGAVLGNTLETSSDADGHFTIRVPMYLSSGLRVTGRNNIEFLVEDEAGNVGQHKVNIMYTPGCPDWQVNIGEIQAYPFNLYTQDFTDTTVEGSAFIPIEYLGPGTPTNIKVQVSKDTGSVHESIFGNTGKLIEQGDGTDLVRIQSPKVSQFDPTSRRIYLYVPVTIERYTGSVNKLPDQINVFLQARIGYRSDSPGHYGGSYTGSFFNKGQQYQTGYANCEVYPVLSYSIQKPLDYSMFLTPSMINKTIKALDKTINVSKKIAGYVKKAALYTMIGCAAMVAFNYLGAAFGSSQTSVAGTCTATEKDMESTYWVCDRILCPTAPAKCEDKDWDKGGFMDGNNVVSEDTWDTRNGENKQTTKEYVAWNNEKYSGDPSKQIPLDQIDTPGVINNNDVSAWASSQGGKTYHKDLGSGAKIYTYNDPITDETHTFEYIDIKNRKIVNTAATYQLTKEAEGGTPLVDIRITDSNSRASQCSSDDQTLVRVKKQSKEDKTPFKGSKKIIQPDYFCEHRPSNLLGEPDSSYLGCYSEECPNFDHTKCLYTADIAPPGGLWSSTRCLCLPGIKSHLDNLVKIMEGTKKCLEQALIGEVRGGFCERLLAQFICDLFTELILKSFLGVGSDDYGLLGGMGGRDTVKNVKTNSKQISGQLSQRYGDIAKNKLGLSGDQLINKFCIAAITMDWSVLEGMLNQVVDSIPVAPIAHIDADSRAYGYDPFNGRMNIGYNIYLGLVPGGRTQTQMWLECDASYPNALCIPGQRKPIPRTFRILDKQSPAVDENIVFVDRGAVNWYNKIVLVMEYELGGQMQTEIIERRINKKGDLAFGCTFSIMQGISCQTLGMIEAQGGLVEVFPVGSGSYLFPKTGTFYQDNKVSMLLRVRNQYKEPWFYVRFTFDDDSSPIEYKLPGSGGEASGGYFSEQTFNLLLGKIGADGLTSLTNAVDYQIKNLDFELGEKDSDPAKENKQSNGILDIQLFNADSAILKISAQAKDGAGQFVNLRPFTCMVFDPTLDADDIYSKHKNYGKAVRKGGELTAQGGSISGSLNNELTPKDYDSLTEELLGDIFPDERPIIVPFIANNPVVSKSELLQKIDTTTWGNDLGWDAQEESEFKAEVKTIIEYGSNPPLGYENEVWCTKNNFVIYSECLTPNELNKFIAFAGVPSKEFYYIDFKEIDPETMDHKTKITNYHAWLSNKYQSLGKTKPDALNTQEFSNLDADFRLNEDSDNLLYTKCLIPQDELIKAGTFGLNAGTFDAEDIVVITSITANVFQSESNNNKLPKLKITSVEKEKETTLNKGSYASLKPGTKKAVGVTAIVLMDTNGNEQGDTPLLYEGRAQQFKFQYYESEPPKSNYPPVVEVIEPLNAQVNDLEQLWIGFNVIDERNEIAHITLRMNAQKSKRTCFSEFDVNEQNEITVTKNECGILESEIKKDNFLTDNKRPNFVRFKINLNEAPASEFFQTEIKNANKDFYTVNIEVTDKEGKIGKSNRGFNLVSIPGVGDVGNIACLGSGGCSEWVGPHHPTEVIMDPSNPETGIQSIVPGQYSQNSQTMPSGQYTYDGAGNPVADPYGTMTGGSYSNPYDQGQIGGSLFPQ